MCSSCSLQAMRPRHCPPTHPRVPCGVQQSGHCTAVQHMRHEMRVDIKTHTSSHFASLGGGYTHMPLSPPVIRICLPSSLPEPCFQARSENPNQRYAYAAQAMQRWLPVNQNRRKLVQVQAASLQPQTLTGTMSAPTLYSSLMYRGAGVISASTPSGMAADGWHMWMS